MPVNTSRNSRRSTHASKFNLPKSFTLFVLPVVSVVDRYHLCYVLSNKHEGQFQWDVIINHQKPSILCVPRHLTCVPCWLREFEAISRHIGLYVQILPFLPLNINNWFWTLTTNVRYASIGIQYITLTTWIRFKARRTSIRNTWTEVQTASAKALSYLALTTFSDLQMSII